MIHSRFLADARRVFTSTFGASGAAFAPLAVPLALLPFFYPLAHMSLAEPLFGDSGVFQYTAWAIRHGLKLYKDVGMADGPFIHYFHAAIQLVVGDGDRAFRSVTVGLLSLIGALLGGLLAPDVALPRAGRVAHRAVWAALGLTVWLTWYFTLDWTQNTEREVYYASIGSLGMALLYVRPADEARRGNIVATFVGGLLVTSQIFGKPTGLAYVGLGALALLFDRAGTAEARRLRWRWAAYGALACLVVILLLLLTTGSVRGYFFWCVEIPYVGNKFLYGREPMQYLVYSFEDARRIALLSFGLGGAALIARILPWKAVGFVLAPPVLFLGSVLQARGYAYQFIPPAVMGYLLLLVTTAQLWVGSERPRWVVRQRTLAALALTFVAYQAYDTTVHSPSRWNGDKELWKLPVSKTRYADLSKDIGRYIKEQTAPNDTVFAYDDATCNMHFTLLTAERKTASPFFYTFWLDPVGLLPKSDVKPNAAQLAALERLQARTRREACDAIQQNDPAVIVTDRLDKVVQICPALEGALATRYKERAPMGTFHLYFRN